MNVTYKCTVDEHEATPVTHDAPARPAEVKCQASFRPGVTGEVCNQHRLPYVQVDDVGGIDFSTEESTLAFRQAVEADHTLEERGLAPQHHRG